MHRSTAQPLKAPLVTYNGLKDAAYHGLTQLNPASSIKLCVVCKCEVVARWQEGVDAAVPKARDTSLTSIKRLWASGL